MSARKWVAVLSVVALLTGQTSAESIRPVGLILEAGKARLGDSEATSGSSVFTEQQLSTDAGGRLRVQLGQAQIALGGKSDVWLALEGGELRAVLRSGTASFAAKDSHALELSASGVLIHTRGDQPAHGTVQMVSPVELVGTSHAGSLTASFAGTTQIIPAGTSYRASLAPPQGPQGAGKRRGVAPIVWVAIGGAAALGVGLWLALRDNDVSPSVP